jgi:hypothetical protein
MRRVRAEAGAMKKKRRAAHFVQPAFAHVAEFI